MRFGFLHGSQDSMEDLEGNNHTDFDSHGDKSRVYLRPWQASTTDSRTGSASTLEACIACYARGGYWRS
jgi:hypothetical protein